jgi:hypothetical protein
MYTNGYTNASRRECWPLQGPRACRGRRDVVMVRLDMCAQSRPVGPAYPSLPVQRGPDRAWRSPALFCRSLSSPHRPKPLAKATPRHEGHRTRLAGMRPPKDDHPVYLVPRVTHEGAKFFLQCGSGIRASVTARCPQRLTQNARSGFQGPTKRGNRPRSSSRERTERVAALESSSLKWRAAFSARLSGKVTHSGELYHAVSK